MTLTHNDTAHADQAAAIEHFAAKLSFETDPTDVVRSRAAGDEFVLVDTRSDAAWKQGRAAGAIHMPTATIRDRAAAEIPAGTPVVVYCWSPGCNGGTKAALEFARLGYPVKEMIGGFEYWAREGYNVVGEHGPVERAADPLTATVDGFVCDC